MVIPAAMLKRIADAAEAAYPDECCGLLVGRDDGATTLRVTRVAETANIAAARGTDVFEVDPQARFDLMRALDGGPERIVGHYHSHPDQPAQPSARDLALAFEPDLAWLIVSVVGGQAVHVTAHVLDAAGTQFRPVALRTDDWRPYPMRDESV